MSESLPHLGVFELRALLRPDRVLHCSMPVVIVSLQAQLRFASGFGRLASGPMAALYVPPTFRLTLEPDCVPTRALALTLAWRKARAPARRPDMLPARAVIHAPAFAALDALPVLAPAVVAPDTNDAVRRAIEWLLHAQNKRRGRCQGHRTARHALRYWSDTVTAAEDALLAVPPMLSVTTFPLPEALLERPALRRFQSVTGYGPRRYLREYRARAGGVQA
jgi:hypothetical protein